MPTIELWLFMVTDPRTGKHRRTTYRLTVEEARARYVNPESVPNSLEVREVSEQRLAVMIERAEPLSRINGRADDAPLDPAKAGAARPVRGRLGPRDRPEAGEEHAGRAAGL